MAKMCITQYLHLRKMQLQTKFRGGATKTIRENGHRFSILCLFCFSKTFQCTLAVTDFTPFMGFESCVTFSEEGDKHNIYLHKDTFPLSLYSAYSRFYFQGLITIKLKARQGLPSCQIKKSTKTILMAWRLIISYFQVLNKLQLFSHSS